MTKPDDDSDPWQRLRPNHGDRLHDQQLQRDVQAINEQTVRALGPLPLGGLPAQPKRKPQLPRPAVPPVTPGLPPSDEDTTMQWKSVAAVAALATGSTLAACGADGSPSQADSPAAVVQEAPARVEMPPVEAIPPSERPAEADPAASADPVAPEPERGPAIPAAQLRRQILALLGSFQTLKDLERGNVERHFGVRMHRDPKAADGYKYVATTTEGWTYWIDTSRIYGKDSPSTTYISLDNGVEPFTNQEPTYCTLEFEPLAKELVAMGYESDSRAYPSGRDTAWGFGRRFPEHKAGFGVEVLIFEVMLEDGGKSTCIEGFRIGGGEVDG